MWATLAALLVMGFTAAFAAGIVHHLISGRHVALVGRRVMPRSGHVVVAGMGQVGLRLAQELRALGIAVVGIERYATAPGLPIARDLGIPVVIGDASSRSVLRRAGLRNAVALVAAGSEERDNIAVAISAQAVAGNVNVMIRAGADDAIDETRSLFRIGSVTDVNGLTAAFVVQSMVAAAPYAVISVDDRVLSVDDTGLVTSHRHRRHQPLHLRLTAPPPPEDDHRPPLLLHHVPRDTNPEDGLRQDRERPRLRMPPEGKYALMRRSGPRCCRAPAPARTTAAPPSPTPSRGGAGATRGQPREGTPSRRRRSATAAR